MIQQCSTDLYRTAVTSSYCVSYRRLAIIFNFYIGQPVTSRCLIGARKTVRKRELGEEHDELVVTYNIVGLHGQQRMS